MGLQCLLLLHLDAQMLGRNDDISPRNFPTLNWKTRYSYSGSLHYSYELTGFQSFSNILQYFGLFSLIQHVTCMVYSYVAVTRPENNFLASAVELRTYGGECIGLLSPNYLLRIDLHVSSGNLILIRLFAIAYQNTLVRPSTLSSAPSTM